MTSNLEAQNKAGALLTSAAARIFQDPSYAKHDWRHIALVFNFKDGRRNRYGYIFRADGSWSAETPDDRDSAILDEMLELQNTMAEVSGTKWHRALIHIDSDAQMNAQFEYDDPDRWAIRPSDLEASVEALRPR